MEEEIFWRNTVKKVLITGPESTGKTELAVSLSQHFGGICIPEYARGYIDDLDGPYLLEDVENIARNQVEEYDRVSDEKGWVFFDTWLVITRVWFDVVYGLVPAWVDNKIRQADFDLVLLCAPDIPWIDDPVRENGGENREKLFERYKTELDEFGMNWKLVTGTGEERLLRAIQITINH